MLIPWAASLQSQLSMTPARQPYSPGLQPLTHTTGENCHASLLRYHVACGCFLEGWLLCASIPPKGHPLAIMRDGHMCSHTNVGFDRVKIPTAF